MTAAGARDAHRSNAGQKASALAESGINNALAVLNANYPGVTIHPGNKNLLLSTTLTGAVTLPADDDQRGEHARLQHWIEHHLRRLLRGGHLHRNHVDYLHRLHRRRGRDVRNGHDGRQGDSVRSQLRDVVGTLVNVPTNPSWNGSGSSRRSAGSRIRLARSGRRQESDRRRAGRIPDSLGSRHHGHRLDLRAQRRHLRPVRGGGRARLRGHDINLRNSAKIAETIPQSLTLPARPNRIAVGHDLYLGPAEPGRPRQRSAAGERPRRDPRREPVRLAGRPDRSPLRMGRHRQDLGRYPRRQRHPARLHHDSDAHLLQRRPVDPAGSARDCARRRTAPRTRRPKLHGLLVPERRPRPEIAMCHQRLVAEVRHRERERRRHDQRERLSEGRPVQTHGDATYSCTSADGQTKLAWDGTTLTIKGTVFIDGSATTAHKQHRREVRGKGTIILSGLYTMDNNNALCVNLSSDGTAATRTRPGTTDTTALAIVADGIDTSCTAPR